MTTASAQPMIKAGVDRRLPCYIALIAVVLVVHRAPAFGALPGVALQQAKRAYDRGEYQRVITLLTPLLYPTNRLSGEATTLTAHKLLGVSHVFEGKRQLAQKAFFAILSLRPDFSLDPLVDPEAAVELFEQVKRSNAERLRRVRERIAAQQAQRKRSPQPPGKELVIEHKTIQHSYWVNFLPFALGQFQNGHRRKGYTLLALQVAFGGTSLVAALWHRAAYSGTIELGSPDERAAGRLAAVQVISGALFFASVAYSIVDALIYFEPQTTHQRRYYRRVPGATASERARLAPALVGSRGAGLSLHLSF